MMTARCTRAMLGAAMMALLLSGVAGAEDSRDALIRELTAAAEMKDKQIDKLKFELDRLKDEVARLKYRLESLEGKGAAGKTEPAPAGTTAPPIKPATPADRPVAKPAPLPDKPALKPPLPPDKPSPTRTVAPDTRPARPSTTLSPPQTALKQKVASIAFDEQTLEQVMESFREDYGLHLWVKWNQLASAGVQRKALVRLELTNVTVGKALQMVLDEVSTSARVEYAVQEDMVVVSLADDLAGRMETRTYDVNDLLSVRNHAQTAARLVATIRTSINPTSWKGAGGEGDIRELGGRLIVTTNTRNHQAIFDLLKTLRDQEQR